MDRDTMDGVVDQKPMPRISSKQRFSEEDVEQWLRVAYLPQRAHMLIGSGSNMSSEKYQKQPRNEVRHDQPGVKGSLCPSAPDSRADHRGLHNQAD